VVTSSNFPPSWKNWRGIPHVRADWSHGKERILSYSPEACAAGIAQAAGSCGVQGMNNRYSKFIVPGAILLTSLLAVYVAVYRPDTSATATTWRPEFSCRSPGGGLEV